MSPTSKAIHTVKHTDTLAAECVARHSTPPVQSLQGIVVVHWSQLNGAVEHWWLKPVVLVGSLATAVLIFLYFDMQPHLTYNVVSLTERVGLFDQVMGTL